LEYIVSIIGLVYGDSL